MQTVWVATFCSSELWNALLAQCYPVLINTFTETSDFTLAALVNIFTVESCNYIHPHIQIFDTVPTILNIKKHFLKHEIYFSSIITAWLSSSHILCRWSTFERHKHISPNSPGLNIRDFMCHFQWNFWSSIQSFSASRSSTLLKRWASKWKRAENMCDGFRLWILSPRTSWMCAVTHGCS